MKRLHTHSQHFLRSPRLVKTLLGHTTIKRTDTVLDIGAGSGIISAVLAEKCQHVIAIEHEPRAADKLRDNMRAYDNVEVIRHDILDVTLPTTPYKIMANIPFHLSSPIVRRLTETDTPPDAIYLITQKQFAQKLLLDSSSFTGMLGAFIAPLFSTRIRYTLQRTDYTPPPAVDTVFIELLRRAQPLVPVADMPAYRAFVEQCFSRQKYFQTLPVTKRPSELSEAEWVRLYKEYGQTTSSAGRDADTRRTPSRSAPSLRRRPGQYTRTANGAKRAVSRRQNS